MERYWCTDSWFRRCCVLGSSTVIMKWKQFCVMGLKYLSLECRQIMHVPAGAARFSSYVKQATCMPFQAIEICSCACVLDVQAGQEMRMQCRGVGISPGADKGAKTTTHFIYIVIKKCHHRRGDICSYQAGAHTFLSQSLFQHQGNFLSSRSSKALSKFLSVLQGLLHQCEARV